jgi:hypothetical protein
LSVVEEGKKRARPVMGTQASPENCTPPKVI